MRYADCVKLGRKDVVDGSPNMDALVDVFKALANPMRVQILVWLKDANEAFADYAPIADRAKVGVCISHIQAKSGLAQSTVSSYMSTLEAVGLVISTRVGKWTHFRRNEARMNEIRKALKSTL